MTIESCQLEQFLPEDPQKEITVAYPDGTRAFPAVRREVIALAKHDFVCGVANKHGYLRYVRLLVSMRAAMRIIRRFRRPPVMNDSLITRPRQSGMRWKQRADNGSHPRSSRERLRWSFDHHAADPVSDDLAEGGIPLPDEPFLQKSRRVQSYLRECESRREARQKG